jgi:hypothetical protein
MSFLRDIIWIQRRPVEIEAYTFFLSLFSVENDYERSRTYQ